MDDLISRQAAIDALKVAYWDKEIQSAKDDPCIVDAMTDWAIRTIKELPSANKSGHWSFAGDNMFECTNCKVAYTTAQLNALRNYDKDPYMPNFCPNCGADMRGEKND